MSRFKPASAEEMAARGLNPDGTPLKKAEPVAEKKPAAKKKPAPKKKG
ncbi:MAG: hypothetical protein ACPHEP_09335 [Acidimicrobiales bacterium]